MNGETVHRAQVFRLYPTSEQEQRLSQWVGAVRAVYNVALEQRRAFWRPGRQFNFVTQGRELKDLRAENEWIADVPRDCLDQALRDLDGAFRAWWERRAGRPNFRCRGQNDSIRFPKPSELGLRKSGKRSGKIKLPKLGEVTIRANRPMPDELRNVTVFRRAGKWFAACVHRAHVAAPVASGAPVGIDRGVRIFAALSNGDVIAGPNVGRKAAGALARAQRQLARKQKGSRNRDKAKLRVARLRMRVANARKDFLHKASTTIAQNHGVVVLEDLRIGNMTRSARGTIENPGKMVRQKAGLNRSILDQGWGMFQRFLAYKLAERGGELVLVPANDTSRTCAACGIVDKASRSGARFSCTACGHTDDADLNAAINILRRGRAPVLPVEGSPAKAPDETGTGGRAA